MTKKLYYACQASGWLYHFVKKHYAPAHIPIDWTCKIHAHDITVFTNLHFHSLHGDNNGIVLKCPYYAIWNVHNLVLGVSSNSFTCMQGHKTLSFSYNMCNFTLFLNDTWFVRGFIFPNPSFARGYSALIGSMTQSVVIGLLHTGHVSCLTVAR